MRIGENVLEVLNADLASEQANQSCLKAAIEVCENLKDFVSREVLEGILEDTEEHIDWIEMQLSRIELTSLEAYLQEQMYS